MRNRVAVVAALLLALLAPAAQGAPSANTLNNQIQQVGEDLDNANAKVKTALKDYEKAKTVLSKAKTVLSKANQVASSAHAADVRATAAVDRAQARTDAAAKKLSSTQASLQGERRLVTQLIGSVYRSGPFSQMTAVLSAQSPEDLTERLQILNTWSAKKAEVIRTLTEVQEKVSAQKAELQVLEAQLTQKQNEVHAAAIVAQQTAARARQAKEQYDAAAAKLAKLLKVAMSHRDSVKKRYEALKAEQARLAAQAKKGSQIGAGLTFTGELVWPVSGGQVTQRTGSRIHPVYGYRSCHTGIDIGASRGTPIRVAADGIVISVIYSGPYGRHTLVAHGSGLTTMYAHENSSQVREGQKVRKGQVIGTVGSTGWSTGPHLHFEVRIDGTAYNPLGWFGQSKTQVRC